MAHSTSSAALIYLHSTSERQHTLADAVAARIQSELGQTARCLMPWHVCGAAGRSLALPLYDPRSSCALTWDFVGAPSATRTRDLLLRRQLLYPLSYRGQPGQGGSLLAGPKPNRSPPVPPQPTLADARCFVVAGGCQNSRQRPQIVRERCAWYSSGGWR
jgi:hypothetical protein